MKRLEVLLYNAISLLSDETYEQFDNEEEWVNWLCNELDCTKEELESFGVEFEV